MQDDDLPPAPPAPEEKHAGRPKKFLLEAAEELEKLTAEAAAKAKRKPPAGKPSPTKKPGRKKR